MAGFGIRGDSTFENAIASILDLSGTYFLIFLISIALIGDEDAPDCHIFTFACRVDSHHLQENFPPIFVPESALSMNNRLEAQPVLKYTDSWFPNILFDRQFSRTMLSKHSEQGYKHRKRLNHTAAPHLQQHIAGTSLLAVLVRNQNRTQRLFPSFPWR